MQLKLLWTEASSTGFHISASSCQKHDLASRSSNQLQRKELFCQLCACFFAHKPASILFARKTLCCTSSRYLFKNTPLRLRGSVRIVFFKTATSRIQTLCLPPTKSMALSSTTKMLLGREANLGSFLFNILLSAQQCYKRKDASPLSRKHIAF